MDVALAYFQRGHVDRRRTAMTMLILWLFTLASGVVNACVLENAGTHGHAQVAAGGTAARSVRSVDVTAGHLGVVVGHGEAQNPSDPPCLKACDESSRALVIKAPSGLDLTGPGLAPLATIPRVPPPRAFALPRRAGDARTSPAEPPARLRFARLAL